MLPHYARLALSFLTLTCMTTLLSVAPLAPATAADISVVPGTDGRSARILLKGSFEDGDDKKFKHLALDLDDAVVVLQSPGGMLGPALEIGRAIHFKGFGTTVINSNCASSCALVWLAGRPRSMTREANMGFHSASETGKDGEPERSNVGNALIGAYLNSLGLSDDVVAFVTSAGPDVVNRLTRAEANALNLPVVITSKFDNRQEAYARHNQALKERGGDTPDLSASVRDYRFAAEAGYAGSQNNLGDYYETGEGVPQNEKFAVYWYARAAERGEPTAYLSLSTLLPKGTSDPAVLVEALKFAILAADNLPEGKNHADAVAHRQTLRAQMSAADQKHAELLAERWEPLFQEPRLMGDRPGP